MGQYGDLYAGSRKRISALVSGLGEEELATVVPACPGWTVKAVMSHVVGIPADIAAGDLDKLGDTDRQVAIRAEASIDEIVEEWAACAPGMEATLDELPFDMAGGPLLGDIYSHEHDIRLALGMEPADDAETLAAALEYYVNRVADRVGEQGLAPVRLRADGIEHVTGDGEPAATVEADAIDLLRSLSGRRTAEQVRALSWEGEAQTYVEIFSEYGWPDTAIE